MKKRNFLIGLLVCLMVCTSFTFFACAKKYNAKETVDRVSESLTTMKNDTDMFEVKSFDGYSMNFYLKNFQTKLPGGGKVDDDENYILLNGFAFNHIEKYYTKIQHNKKNFKSINSKLNKMNKKFDLLKDEGMKLIDADKNATYDIYNAHFVKYKLYARDFIDSVYNLAFSISDFLIDQLDAFKLIGKEGQEQDKYVFFADYQNLLIANDFKEFFLHSAKGQTFKGDEIYDQVSSQLKDFINMVSGTRTIVDYTKTKVLMGMFDTLANERVMLNKAIDKFSFYDLQNSVNHEAYFKIKPMAKVYCGQIENFYKDGGIFSSCITYMIENMYA